jgi:hypothetical protein
MEATMDGSHYNFSREMAAPAVPWWRRRIDSVRGVLLMLAIAVGTFTVIVALDRQDIPVPTIAQGMLP